jgi:hypothetical protein
MRGVSDAESAIVGKAGLPANLRTQKDWKIARISQKSNMIEHQPEDDADAKSKQNIRNSIQAANLNPIGESDLTQLIPWLGPVAGPVIEFAFGTGCYVFGDDLQAWGHVYWGFFFHYLTLVFGSLLIANLIFTRLPKRKYVLTILGIWCILLGLFYVYNSFPKPRPEPPLPEPAPAPIEERWKPPTFPHDITNIKLRYNGWPFECGTNHLQEWKAKGYPFNPYIKSNRLYIEVNAMIMNGWRTVYMDDQMRTEVMNHPGDATMDANFDDHCFEAVYVPNPSDPKHVQFQFRVTYKNANTIELIGHFSVDPKRPIQTLISTPDSDAAPMSKYPSDIYKGVYAATPN